MKLINIGVTAKRKFGLEEVMAYARLTGDFNPLHFNENYIKETIINYQPLWKI